MKKALILSLLLTGCAQDPLRSDSKFSTAASYDGYRFVQKEYETLSPGVKFVLMRSPEEYRSVMYEQFGPNWRNVSAFTKWNMKEATCKIYIKDPAWAYEPEMIGHEVAHCIWGRFHDGENGRGDLVNSWTRRE